MNKKTQTLIFKAQYGDRIQKSTKTLFFKNLIKKWFLCVVRPYQLGISC